MSKNEGTREDMAERLKVIDLLSGIGGRSLGFQQAGYDVIYALDNLVICEEVYTREVGNNQFVLADIENVVIENLPEADVITAKLLMHAFRATELSKKEPQKENEVIFKIISNRRPKAFVLEIPSVMITSNRSTEFRSLLELDVLRNYFVSYRIVKEAEFSGFPVIGSQAYMVGIRTDLYHDEFYFPQGESSELHMFQEEAD